MWPRQNKLQTSWLTHDTMRMMVCGCWKKVMGSKAPPAFPAPYACIPSMVQTPVCSAPLARRCFKGWGCAEPRDAEYPRSCCRCCGCRSTDGWMDGWMEMDGWPYHHAEPSAQSRNLVFLKRKLQFDLWINSSDVPDRYSRRSCGLISLYYDAASSAFNAQAGGGHVNAAIRSRPSWSVWGGRAHAVGRWVCSHALHR